MDLSLDKGRSAVICETRQYNHNEIVETEVMGMYDAAGSRHVTVRPGHCNYLIENRSTRLSLYYGELDENAISPEAEKQIKQSKDSTHIGRIIGNRHNYFSTKKKIKLDCLSSRSFAFSPRAPKYLTIGIRGLENSYTLNEGDQATGSSGVLTVDVEVRTLKSQYIRPYWKTGTNDW